MPQFYIVGDLSGGYSQTDCKFNFNANVNVTGDNIWIEVSISVFHNFL